MNTRVAMKLPCRAMLLAVLVTNMSNDLSAADDDAPKSPALPAHLELLAGQPRYKEQPGEEQTFVGVLTKVNRKGEVGFGRFNPLRLDMKDGSREVYAGDRKDALMPYVGQRLKIVGKAVDMEVEGTVHHEVWPARISVLKAGTMEEVSKTEPVKPPELADKPDDSKRAVEILARAPHSGAMSPGIPVEPKGTVVRNQEQLVKLVGEDTAKGLPKLLKVDGIDFDKKMLIHVFGGQASSGGHRVNITGIDTDEGAKILTVHWELKETEGISTTVISYPGEIVLVERFDGDVKFDPPMKAK